MDKITSENAKYKVKLEKNCLKKQAKTLTGLKKDATLSKSNPDFESSFNSAYTFQVDSAKANFKCMMETTRQKHVEKIKKIYEELYKNIKTTKIASTDAVSYYYLKEY